MLMLVVCSCNIDGEYEALPKPEIRFDHDDGIYTVKVGGTLTLAPDVTNGDDARCEWSMDGVVVCTGRVWISEWPEAGEYYALFTVTAPGGVAREEVRIDVLAATPPTISLSIPPGGITLLAGSTYTFAPRYQHQDMEGFSVAWYVNGDKAAEGAEFGFRAQSTGHYRVTVEASNIDGTTVKEFEVTVVDSMPSKVTFMPLSYFEDADVRYTVPGRPVSVQAISSGCAEGDYVWSVNGNEVACRGSLMVYTPEALGDYIVKVNASGAEAVMKIVCVNAVAPGPDGGSGSEVDVVEWVPAPGQFIGETSSIGGMTSDIVTRTQAERWATARLKSGKFVSLGAWGGYLTVKFPHGVTAGSGQYDFAIKGNAIDTSNEPGIVWVMQDVNGNGLPDDEWYQLRGSDFSAVGVSHGKAVTYYRPGGARMDVEWTSADGLSGMVAYIGGSHNQPFYYPAWIEPECYTLYGTWLPSRTVYDSATGQWSNPPFAWGYADNLGSDMIGGGDTQSGLGQWIGFSISNAVAADGRSVSLDHIDFVKVQTGVMSSGGRLGELSTEVCGFTTDFGVLL